MIEKYKGKLLARSGVVTSLEDPAKTRGIVIVELPSLDIAKELYNSE